MAYRSALPQPMTAAALRAFYAHESVEAGIQQAALPTMAAGIVHGRLQDDDVLYREGVLASCAAARCITSISLRCTTDLRDLVVDRLIEHIAAHKDLQPEFDLQKKQALRRASQSSWSARAKAEHRVRQTLYGPNHSFGWTHAGDYCAIEKVTCEQVAAWLHDLRENLLVVFADDCAPVALNRSSEWTGALPPTDRVRTPKMMPLLPATHVHLTGCSTDEVCEFSGAIGPPHGHDDFEPAQLANLLLHKVGMMGRLGGWYRAHGLAYEYGASIEGGWGPGLWKLYAVLPRSGNDLEPSAIPGILDRFLHSAISEDELEAARRMRTQQRLANQADSEGRVGQLAHDYFLPATPEDDSVREALQSISPIQIKDAITRYWGENATETHSYEEIP